MPLDVIIVGAGLAGLASANGLRRAGHRVRVFEKSAFRNEIGAGISVTPNGSRILKQWGFDFERARAVVMRGIRVHDGETSELLAAIPVNAGPEPDTYMLYRPDYHAELWRMATTEEGEGPPATVTLGSELLSVDAEAGKVSLVDGSTHTADLIIGADGIHSRVRESIFPGEVIVRHSGHHAYRFRGTREDVEKDAETKALFDEGLHYWSGYKIGDLKFFLIWYDVRGGDLQNYVLQYESEDVPLSLKGTTPEDIRNSLLEDAKSFHPTLQKVIRTGQDIKPWKVVWHEPLSTWRKGKVLLVGDAAHPVNPMNGQGVNTSVEDGATLQILLKGISDSNSLSKRLEIFEDLRLPRTAVIQFISTVLPGRERDVADRVAPYLRGNPPLASAADREKFILTYDALAEAEKALKVSQAS